LPNKNRFRKYIRHPADVPIQVSVDLIGDDTDDAADQTLTNLSLGGLSFISSKPLDLLATVQVSIPILEQDSHLKGKVVWCEKTSEGFEIGLQFEGKSDVFQLRMIEQICHIEHYRKEIKLVEGRELSSEEAAREWISKYADEFPSM
jgi:hypothetical protein